MLDEDGTPLRRQYVCRKEDRPVRMEDLVRGYEIAADQFVVVTDEELERLEPKKSREIDLSVFVDEDEIDPLYFERSYFLVPDGETNKAYRLLAEAMESTRQAGVATFVMREREYVIAIFATGGILRAETLRFADEVRPLKELGLTKGTAADAALVRKMAAEIAELRAPKLRTAFLQDENTEKLAKLIEKKRKQKKDVVRHADAPPDDDSDAEPDLIEVLRRSLSGTSDSGPKLVRPKARAKPAAKKGRAPPRRKRKAS